MNAGTVECLYQDGEFWFLEMNTRLQVEHCVTEMTTSLDLVAEQLRVAAGEPLSFTQESIERRGHSIEVRINAEDPAEGFLPSPGTITRLRLPGGPGVRWDGGYAEGDTVSQHYDNLLGKLVVWAPDREHGAHPHAARARRARGRRASRTTIPAHVALLSHPDFAAATHSTKWVEDEVDASVFAAAPARRSRRDADGRGRAELIERTVPVEVNGKRFSVRLWLPEAPARRPRAGSAARGRRPGATGAGGAAGNGTISAPMQGTIVKVLVAVGDTVEPVRRCSCSKP